MYQLIFKLSRVFKSVCYDTRVLTIPETENQISKGTKWLKTEILCTFLCNYLVDNEEIYTR